MKVSDYMVSFLVQKGISTVFALTGGAVVHLVDSLGKNEKIDYICVRHEQAAAFAAVGFQQIAQNVGVAVATSGPGSTNLVTGIGTAWASSIPCLFIAGQADSFECNWQGKARQKGHQEIDFEGIVKPITKYAKTIMSPDEVRHELEKAWAIATSGRPGPVVLIVPCDFFRRSINPHSCKRYLEETRVVEERRFESKYNSLVSLLRESRRPLVLVGGGIGTARARPELSRVVKKLGIPVVVTQSGIDCFPHDQKEYLGWVGAYGNRSANLAAANTDLLIVLGSRLTSRTTGFDTGTFAREARKVVVEIDKNQIDLRVRADLAFNMDVKPFLEVLGSDAALDIEAGRYGLWLEYVSHLREKYFTCDFWQTAVPLVNPYLFLHALGRHLVPDDILVVDCGHNIMRALQVLPIQSGQRFLADTGLVSMGYGLPAAIGAVLASGGQRRVILLTGDGSFQMNIQELETIRHYSLPVKMIVMNNRSYGMIKQMQDQVLEGRHEASGRGYSAPDFTKVVQAFDIPARSLKTEEEIGQAVTTALTTEGPYCLDVYLPEDMPVLPKVAGGRPLEEQMPLLPEDEWQKLMIVKPYPRN